MSIYWDLFYNDPNELQKLDDFNVRVHGKHIDKPKAKEPPVNYQPYEEVELDEIARIMEERPHYVKESTV